MDKRVFGAIMSAIAAMSTAIVCSGSAAAAELEAPSPSARGASTQSFDINGKYVTLTRHSEKSCTAEPTVKTIKFVCPDVGWGSDGLTMTFQDKGFSVLVKETKNESGKSALDFTEHNGFGRGYRGTIPAGGIATFRGDSVAADWWQLDMDGKLFHSGDAEISVSR